MKTNYVACELCNSSDIAHDGDRVYRVPDGTNSSAFNRSRLEILFSEWFPGRQEVTLSSMHCRRCGFSVYQPRPETADIDRKYRYLETSGANASDRSLADAGRTLAERRSALLYESVARHGLVGNGTSILDYGGGDGSLMTAFQKRGCQCFVVDYALSVVPGVERLASTLDEVSADLLFDGIVCSHVFEHVADVGAIGRALAAHLRPNGWMYVEVPMELWRRPLPHSEPVTHINFFTPASVHNLLVLCGMNVVDVTLTAVPHSNGRRIPVIKGIARKSAIAPAAIESRLAPSDVEAWLRPTWGSWLKYVSAYPEIWKYELLRLVRRGA